MCRPHWFQLPARLRVRILDAYDREAKHPSAAWMTAAHEARALIADSEKRPGVAKFQLAQAAIWRARRDAEGK